MQVSDDLYLGPAVAGGSGVSVGPSPMTVGVGPLGRVYVYDIAPAALAANNLATSQNPGSGASFTLTAGAGITQVTLANGVLGYQFDVPRAVRVVAAGANTATYTISGYDVYGQAMTQTIAAPSTSTVTTTKAFKVVTSITNANATAGTNNLTVGTTDVFGLPVAVSNVAYILSVKWDATLASNAGTFTAADATTPSATTGDVRGTFLQTGNASDGTRRLVIAIAVPAIGSGPTATRAGAFGLTQF
jgi:hypothetical protein